MRLIYAKVMIAISVGFMGLPTNAYGQASVSFAETSFGVGIFKYDVTVKLGNGSLNLYEIRFAFPSQPSVLAVPEGWSYTTLGNSIDSFSTNVGIPPNGTDVAPNGSLAGFTFQIDRHIDSLSFTAKLRDPANPLQATSVSGSGTLSSMPIPGDLNGDGIVDCGDVGIVTASLGKQFGQSGFDPRADVNGDLVVDSQDAAFVSSRLPPGTSCNPASVTLDSGGLLQAYNGKPKSVSVSTVPPGLVVSLTYDGFAESPIAVGQYVVVATITGFNYQGSATGTLTITYGICLLYDPTRAVLSGSTIPLKIQLCDSNNTDVSRSTVVVHAVSLVQTSTNASEVLQASGNANPGNNFRFDPTLGPTGGYIFNLNTQGLTTGSYQLTFTAAEDPLPHVLTFQVR